MAEFILKHLTAKKDGFKIASAAVSREEIGNDLYPPAKDILRMYNIPFTRHHARQVTPQDYDIFDYLIVMDSSNLSLLKRIIPADPQQKICRLLDFTDDPHDISDPWYTGRFDLTYHEILTGCRAFLEKIR